MSKVQEYRNQRKIALSNKKGNMGMAGAIMGLAVVVVIVASVAIPLVMGVDTTGWGATDILLIGLIPTLFLLSIVMSLVYRFL